MSLEAACENSGDITELGHPEGSGSHPMPALTLSGLWSRPCPKSRPVEPPEGAGEPGEMDLCSVTTETSQIRDETDPQREGRGVSGSFCCNQKGKQVAPAFLPQIPCFSSPPPLPCTA